MKRRMLRTFVRHSPWTAGVLLVLFVISFRLTVHVQPRVGCLLSLVRGCVRVHTWDTMLWRIDYPPWVSTEDNGWGIDWLGDVHLGGASIARGPGMGQYVIEAPLWVPAAALGAIGCFGRKRAWGSEAGRCGTCGYDLHGLPAGAACPECGAGGAAA